MTLRPIEKFAFSTIESQDELDTTSYLSTINKISKLQEAHKELVEALFDDDAKLKSYTVEFETLINDYEALKQSSHQKEQELLYQLDKKTKELQKHEEIHKHDQNTIARLQASLASKDIEHLQVAGETTNMCAVCLNEPVNRKRGRPRNHPQERDASATGPKSSRIQGGTLSNITQSPREPTSPSPELVVPKARARKRTAKATETFAGDSFVLKVE
jgi:hypothetical protein